MSKMLLRVLLLLLFVPLMGCASIISGNGPQAIPVNTNPSEARIEVMDITRGQPVLDAKTPYTILLNRSAGYFKKREYKIKASKNGFITREKVVTPKVSGWYLGGNIIFGGLIGWFIVDPVTGAMYKFTEDSISMVLYPDTPDGRAALKLEEERKAKEEADKKAKEDAENSNPTY
jgi:uncharacterized protein YceK